MRLGSGDNDLIRPTEKRLDGDNGLDLHGSESLQNGALLPRHTFLPLVPAMVVGEMD
jgi:hypothetical protein